MDKSEQDALAADLELASHFGLKGFIKTPDSPSTASASAKHLVPDDASEDLALARAFGLKGFTDEPLTVAPANVVPSTPAPTQPEETNDASADLILARQFGLKGFAAKQDESVAQPATPDHSAATSAKQVMEPVPAVSVPTLTAKSAHRPRATPKARKAENFLQITGTCEALKSLEATMGRPIATTVRGKKSYHSQRGSSGAEIRLFSIPPGGIVGLDSICGEVAPGVRASIKRANLNTFQSVGMASTNPIHVQPDLVAALIRVLAK